MFSKQKPKNLYKSSISNLDEPEDYFLKQKEQYQNENTSQEYLPISSSYHSELIESCIGRLVSIFYKKPRKHSKKFLDTNEELVVSGTAFLIGKNTLPTVGHNIFLKEFNLLASQVHFFPENLNKSGNAPFSIKAKAYKVYDNYSNPECEYYNKYDIGLVVLEQNTFSTDKNFLDIEWSYKRWEDKDKNLTIYGYPFRLNQNNKWKLDSKTNTTNSQENESIFYYHETGKGFNGGPLIKVKQHNAGPKITVVGLHKGQTAKGWFGITFNTLPSTQQVIYQLCEELRVENALSSYQHSEKKLRQKTSQQLSNQNLFKNTKSQFELNPINCLGCQKLSKENLLLKQQTHKNNQLINELKVTIDIKQKQIKSLNEVIERLQKRLNQMSNKKSEKKLQFSPSGKEQKKQVQKQEIATNYIIINQNETISKVQESKNLNPKIQPQQIEKSEDYKKMIKMLDGLDKNVTQINFNFSKIGDDGFKAFTSQAANFMNLTKIEFDSNNISGDGFKTFVVQAVNFMNLTEIVFSDNKISDDGFKAFTAQAANFKNLTEIYFSYNKISDDGFKSFTAQAANFKTLTEIYFDNNKISNSLVQAFKKSFRPKFRIYL